MPTELTNENFTDKTNSGLAVVDFWAPWCGPCKSMAPIFESAAKDFEGDVSFFKVNVDDHPDLASQHNVRGIPTILFLKDGKVVDTHVGLTSEDDLKEKVKTALQ